MERSTKLGLFKAGLSLVLARVFTVITLVSPRLVGLIKDYNWLGLLFNASYLSSIFQALWLLHLRSRIRMLIRILRHPGLPLLLIILLELVVVLGLVLVTSLLLKVSISVSPVFKWSYIHKSETFSQLIVNVSQVFWILDFE